MDANREALLAEALEALTEILAEIDSGGLGRLTAIEGMKGWEETGGTQQARAVMAKAGGFGCQLLAESYPLLNAIHQHSADCFAPAWEDDPRSYVAECAPPYCNTGRPLRVQRRPGR